MTPMVCCSADAHSIPYHLWWWSHHLQTNRPTLDTSQLHCGIYATPTVCPTQTSLTSLAHELRNYL